MPTLGIIGGSGLYELSSIESSKRLLVSLAKTLPDAHKSPAHGALRNAILTDRALISPATRAELAWLL